MAGRLPARSVAQPIEGPPSSTRSPRPDLQIADPGTRRRRFARISTVVLFGLFLTFLALATFMALATLHAVLVENQGALDEMLGENRMRQERIESLQARIAYLDSPEGLAEQASAAGLVPAAELVTLAPIASGVLPRPLDDPFRLVGLEPLTDDPAQAE